MRDVLILSKWFDGLENVSDDVIKILGFRIVKNLIMEKDIDTSTDDPLLKKVWMDIRKDAVGTRDAYEDKKKYGENHGKKMNPASIEAWKYYQYHGKATAKEVGEFLESQGYEIRSSAKKSPWSKVYDLPGWKNKDNKDWLKELGLSENSIENSEEIERNSDGIPIF